MTQLRNLEENSKSEFSTPFPNEENVAVTIEESSETKNNESFRGCEYQTVADGILSLALPSPISNKGIEQYLDFDIEGDENMSDVMEALREHIKCAEQTANVSDKFETKKEAVNVANLQSYKNVGNDDTWSQITSLPMEDLRHTSVASEGKESKTGESFFYEIVDPFRPQIISLKKNKIEASSPYEIEDSIRPENILLKKNKMEESSYGIEDFLRPKIISLKKNKMEESSSYEIEDSLKPENIFLNKNKIEDSSSYGIEDFIRPQISSLKKNKIEDSSSYEIEDSIKPENISLKNKMEESSSYEIEEEDTKGGRQSSKTQNNQTYYLDAPSLVTLIPKYMGGLAALTESNSCSILIEEVKGFESTPQQICSNTSPAESPTGKSIESRSLEKEFPSTEIHSEIRYL